jgi:hypothetical protein
MQKFRRNRPFPSSWNSCETFIQSTRRHIPEDSTVHSNWRVNPLSQPCDITCGILHQAHSTSRSRARGCQRHSLVLHAETFEMRKPLLTFPLDKPGYNAKAISRNYELFIYGILNYVTNSFCKHFLQLAAPLNKFWITFCMVNTFSTFHF